ncbi:MAG: GDYXXLXY domain-containing protein [Verrucomicrobiae bacterium]|nr:GDYXXLXY domain-containing protein [Verrucomicrobiae bacterium]
MIEETWNVSNEPTGLRSLNAAMGWMEARKMRLALFAGALQLAVLLAMILGRLAPLATGETLLVRVVPADPRDIFRGDYVTLNYGFTRLPENSGFEYSYGQPVYVTLVPDADGKHWKMDRFSLTRPATGKYLRGSTAGWGRAEFGIEAFFVQEDQGKKYEDAIRSRKVSAEIAVTHAGHAALKRLVVE